jgi:tRNA threonylcarbamoyladenosine modification (KEOPS) complex Cgi121 subunit
MQPAMLVAKWRLAEAECSHQVRMPSKLEENLSLPHKIFVREDEVCGMNLGMVKGKILREYISNCCYAGKKWATGRKTSREVDDRRIKVDYRL